MAHRAAAAEGSTRVFFVDDGSTAIDAAVKMCAQARRQLGQEKQDALRRARRRVPRRHGGRDEPGRRRGLPPALRGGDLRVRARPLPGARRLRPRVRGDRAPRPRGGRTRSPPSSSSPSCRARRDAHLRRGVPARAPRALRRHDVWLVADEVFAGYGRTGPMWACEHAGIAPDVHVHRQGVRRRTCPMAAVLASEQRLRRLPRRARPRVPPRPHLLRQPARRRAGARGARHLPRRAACSSASPASAPVIARAFERIAALPGVERVRSIGMIGAADLADRATGYLGGVGWRVYEEARRRGAYLRPLGSTVYVCPPLTIDDGGARAAARDPRGERARGHFAVTTTAPLYIAIPHWKVSVFGRVGGQVDQHDLVERQLLARCSGRGRRPRSRTSCPSCARTSRCRAIRALRRGS